MVLAPPRLIAAGDFLCWKTVKSQSDGPMASLWREHTSFLVGMYDKPVIPLGGG